jgi:hypothetical protein
LVGILTLAGLSAFERAAGAAEPGGVPPPGNGPLDVDAVVRVIEGDTMDRPPDAERLEAAGRRAVVERYSWIRIGREYQAAILDACHGTTWTEHAPSDADRIPGGTAGLSPSG